MPEISLAKTAPLRPFKINIRDKELIKALFYKLDIRMFGWNLPALFDKYCLNVDPLLPEEYHYRAALNLVAILVCGDNAALIDDPSARFHEEDINSQLFISFISSFVDELKKIVCNANDRKVHFGLNELVPIV
jgi:hypothetical protein